MRPAIRNIADLRELARRRLPRVIFDYIDGGAEDEQSVRSNRSAFERATLRPRVLVDCGECDLGVDLFGERLPIPVLLAPAGFAGLFWRQGERATARAAASAGVVMMLSMLGVCSLEEVATEAPDAPRWFQMAILRDRELTRELVARAQGAGYRALCITADVPIAGSRERDARNGFTVPPRVTLDNLVDVATSPRWAMDILFGPTPTFRNFLGKSGTTGDDALSLGAFVNRQLDPRATWKDLRWVRDLWKGPLIVKGILRADDALRAIEAGADGVVVSNHGGRQLDATPATLDVLSEIVDAVGQRTVVLLDGGVRRGTDVAKALALGARACLIGRPYLYGLAALGEKGVETAVDIFRRELERALILLGCPRARDLDRSFVKTN